VNPIDTIEKQITLHTVTTQMLYNIAWECLDLYFAKLSIENDHI